MIVVPVGLGQRYSAARHTPMQWLDAGLDRILPVLDLCPAAPSLLRQRSWARALVEKLEERRLLSATIDLSNGVLEVAGHEKDANVISLLVNNQQLIVIVNGTTDSVPVSAVDQINITGGSGNDLISLARNVEVPAWIEVPGGNNFIRGGGGDDTIIGGPGNDYIDGREGDDVIFGGGGNDRIIAGPGNDSVEGGGSGNLIDVSLGKNVIYGPTDGNTLVGTKNSTYTFSGKPISTLLDSGSSTPSNPTPSEPKPSEPEPSEPKPSEPEPSKPAPSEPAPSEPTPSEPKPSEPESSIPPPSEPKRDPISTEPIAPIDSNAKAPKAVIDIMNATTMAGNAVHVSALSSELGVGEAIKARFEWDFGDPGSKYNVLEGFNAAHIYDKPGTYTITLRVTNEAGKQSIRTQKVTISADTRRAVYVSNSGNDRNDGRSPDRAVRTPQRALQLMGNNSKILFKSGETFNVSTGLAFTYENVLFGSYGTGSKPVLRWTGERDIRSLISPGPDSRNVVIENLQFDSIYNRDTGSQGMVKAISPRGQGITIRNNVFLNVGDAINSGGQPQYVLVQDNAAPLFNGIRSYFAWVEGSDHVYLGNVASNSTQEHILRAGGTGVERVLIAHNNFSNSGNKTTMALQLVYDGYVAENTFRDSRIAIGPNWTHEGRGGAVSIVFENNQVLATELAILPGTSQLMVRNNIIHRDDQPAITINATASVASWTLSDIYILHNTAQSDAQRGFFLLLTGRAEGAITLAGNLYLAPNLVPGSTGEPALVRVMDADLGSFKSIQYNVWPVTTQMARTEGGVFFVQSWLSRDGYRTPDWWSSQPMVGEDFYENPKTNSPAPASGTLTATAASPVGGVFTDINGRLRPAGSWTAGAIQI